MGFCSLLNEQFEVSNGSKDENGHRIYKQMNSGRQREQAQKPDPQGLWFGAKVAVVVASGFAGWKLGNKIFEK